jgi:hypothetical protein
MVRLNSLKSFELGNRSDDRVAGEGSRCMPRLSVSDEPRLTGCLLRFAGVAVGAVPQRDVLLIALRGKAQSAIKKLVQQTQQFHLAINFDRAAHAAALALQKFPQMPLGENN